MEDSKFKKYFKFHCAEGRGIHGNVITKPEPTTIMDCEAYHWTIKTLGKGGTEEKAAVEVFIKRGDTYGRNPDSCVSAQVIDVSNIKVRGGLSLFYRTIEVDPADWFKFGNLIILLNEIGLNKTREYDLKNEFEKEFENKNI